MMNANPTARRLKSLRNAARISLRKMADALGWSLSTYSHYELRFKDQYLPLDKARMIASVLAAHGIDEREILALAGVSQAAVGLPVNPPLDEMLLRSAIIGTINALTDARITVPPAEVAHIVLAVYRTYAVSGRTPDSMSDAIAAIINSISGDSF